LFVSLVAVLLSFPLEWKKGKKRVGWKEEGKKQRKEGKRGPPKPTI